MSSFSMVILGDETIASKFRRGIMIPVSFRVVTRSLGCEITVKHEPHQNPGGYLGGYSWDIYGVFMGIFMEIFMGYLWEYLGIFMGISGDIHGKMSEFM
jgi:hypothetical protein